MWDIFASAVVAVVAADHAYLARLPEERRREVLARRAREREERELEAEPEVLRARERIAEEGLSDPGAGILLNFARDLARRRKGA